MAIINTLKRTFSCTQHGIQFALLASLLTLTTGANAKIGDEFICLKKKTPYWVQYTTDDKNQKGYGSNKLYTIWRHFDGSWIAKTDQKKGWNRQQLFSISQHLIDQATGVKQKTHYQAHSWANRDSKIVGGCNPNQNTYGTLDCMEHDLCLTSEAEVGNGGLGDRSCGKEFGHALSDAFGPWGKCVGGWK